MNPKHRILTLNLSRDEAQPPAAPVIDPTRQRLAKAIALLENIEVQRVERQDPLFGRLVEERIVWRELIDLEVQDVDEQIERISTSAGRPAQS